MRFLTRFDQIALHSVQLLALLLLSSNQFSELIYMEIYKNYRGELQNRPCVLEGLHVYGQITIV